jgi:heme exporter protein C
MPLKEHNLIGWVLVAATLPMVSFWVPAEEAQLGSSYLIFFWHFPSAVNCLNLFVIAGVFSALYLFQGRDPSMDRWAAASVEVGMLACTVTLVTGGIWARAAWAEWSVWVFNDPRLLSVYVMWFTYAAYLAFRATIEEPRKRELFAAVFGIVATVNVPVVYFAIRIFGKQNHPMDVKLGEVSMVVTRWFGTAAFLVLYLALLRLRRQVYRRRDDLDRLEAGFARAGI